MSEYSCAECGAKCDYNRVLKNQETAVCAVHYKPESERV